MMRAISIYTRLGAAFLSFSWAQDVIAAPPDTAPTLARMVDGAEHVCLIEASVKDRFLMTLPAGQYQYNIVRVAKSADHLFRPLEDVLAPWPKGATIQDGHLYLLLGRTTGRTDFGWCAPIPITEDQYEYVIGAPSTREVRKRLAYFASFVGSPDERIAGDALAEIGLYSIRDLVGAAHVFPEAAKRRFRTCFTDPILSESARAVSGRVLGIIGSRQDIAAFESRVSVNDGGYHDGTVDVIMGYLFLAGEQALEKIDNWKLKDPTASSFDVQAVLQAVQTVGDEFPQRIRRARLLATVHLILERPDHTREAVALLAHWNDWSAAERLVAIYRMHDHDFYLTKREIVRYLFAATRSQSATPGDIELQKRASRFLDMLREKDPEMVARVQQTLAGKGK